jgi:hypothetical protein
MHFEVYYKCNKHNPKYYNNSAVKKFATNSNYELIITNKYFLHNLLILNIFGGVGFRNVRKYVDAVVRTYRSITTMDAHDSSIQVIFRNNTYLYSLKTEYI